MLILKYIPEFNLDKLEDLVKDMTVNHGVRSFMLLSSSDENMDPETLNPFLRRMESPVFGGAFPGLIYEGEMLRKGFILAGFRSEFRTLVLEDLGIPYNPTEKLLEEFRKTLPSETKSVFVFVDGKASRISHLTESLFISLGLKYKFIGGGTGSLQPGSGASVYTNKGVMMNSAVIAATETDAGIGTGHGWKKMAGPFKITEAEGNRIIRINYKPAFPFYQRILFENTHRELTRGNFAERAMSHPFGVERLDTEVLVRDPVSVGDDDSLVCVGDVHPGSFVYILDGRPGDLLQASEAAAREARTQYDQETGVSFAFLANCISRVLFLGEGIKEELEGVRKTVGNIPLFGVLSLGEIANNGRNYIDFYNKTSVLGIF